MNGNPRGNLRLGSNVIEFLLPQKRPFLMVDGIDSFALEPRPVIGAFRHISANEPVFAGHFDGLHLWPAAYTIEGLGQSGVMLVVLTTLCREGRALEIATEDVLESLRNLERGFRLEPGYTPGAAEALVRRIREGVGGIAVGTSVEVKFPRPVFAGQRLDYHVELSGEHPGGVRFDVEASVDRIVVASGVMMGALVRAPMLPRA